MTVANRRSLRSLQLGTALATTLFAAGLPLPAFGQALPDLGATGSAAGSTIAPSGSPTVNRLDIDLNGGNRVINWESYNVDVGNTVNYLTTSNTSAQLAVLNRVIVPGMSNTSTINGTVSSSSNIVVWLSNPNGILVGPSGSFNTGGLVLTTADIDPNAFLATGGPAEGGAFALNGATSSVTIGGTLTTTGSSGLVGTLLVSAPQITVTGSATASGSAALVAAADATFSAGIGSPLSVTITKGSTVAAGEKLIDVNDGAGTGTPAVSGASLGLFAASDGTVMNTLLNVDGGATLTATASDGVIQLATGATPANPAGFGTSILSAGLLDTSAGGPITLQSDADITVSDGSLDVASANAAGALSLTATAGDLTLGTGSAGGGATLDASDALSVSSLTADSDVELNGSTVDAGSVTSTNGNLTLTADGGAATLGTGSAGGTAMVSALTDATVTTSLTSAGDLTLTAGNPGTASAGALTSNGGSVNVSGGSVDVTSAAAAVALSLNATGGDLTLGSGSALAGDVTLTATGAATIAGDLTAGGTYSVTAASIALGGPTPATQQAAGDIALTATTGDITGAAGLTLRSDSDDAGGGAITLDASSGAIAFDIASTVATGTTGSDSVTLLYDEANDLALGNVTATSLGNGVSSTTLATDGDLTAGNLVIGDAANYTAGGTLQLASLQAAGDIALSGDAVILPDAVASTGGNTSISGNAISLGSPSTPTYSAAGTLTLTGPVTLASDVVLSGADITADGTIDATTIGGQGLAANSLGTTAFLGAIGTGTALKSLATDADGTTDINGGTVVTTGPQTYADDVRLTDDTVLKTVDASGTATGNGAIALLGTVDSDNTPRALTVTTSGDTTFGGTVGSSAALASLTTSGGGTTAINGSGVSTTTTQTYADAVTLGGPTTTLTSSGALAAGDIAFGSTVDGASALTVTTAGTTTFSGAVGGATALTSLATDGGGTTAINGGTVKTAGAQTYSDAVTLGTNPTTLQSTGSGQVRFASTLDGPGSLSVLTSGLTRFDGVVGGNAPLLSLSTGSGGVEINTTSITTAGVPGTQNYNSAVTLGADLAIDAGSGPVTFVSTIDGAHSLTVNTTGNTVFGGPVGQTTALTSLATNAGGTTLIVTPSIRTSGAQTYGDNVLLLVGTTLTGGSGSFAGTVDGNGKDLTLNFGGITSIDSDFVNIDDLVSGGGGATQLSGDITTTGTQSYGEPVRLTGTTVLTAGPEKAVTFSGPVNGAYDLTVNTSGTTSFLGPVGGTVALASLTTDAAGTIDLNGGTVTTSGAQTYNDDVALSANTTLSGSAVTFGKSVNSDGTARSLTVNSSGTTTFGGEVGTGTGGALASLTTDGAGTTRIDGGAVTTTGAQSFGDPVALGTDTVLTGTTGTFAGGLDGDFNNLTLNYSGTSAIGSNFTNIATLTTDSVGTTELSGAITTSGSQIYGDAVVLTGTGATLTANGAASDVSFAKTVDSTDTTQALSVTAGRDAVFLGAVGDMPLASLDVTAGGVIDLNGPRVTTTGTQTYNGPVVLSTNVTLASTDVGDIAFAGSVDSDGTARTLDVNTAGTSSFAGAVGAGSVLASLTTDAAGMTDLNGGSIITSGAQTYNDDVVLTADAELTGSAVSFAKTVNSDGTPRALTVNAAALTAFGGEVGTGAGGALAALTTDAMGTTALNGGAVTTTGNQTYNDAVTLGASALLTATSGDVVFASSLDSLDGGQGLTISAGGAAQLNGVTGAGQALADLTISAASSSISDATVAGDAQVTTSGASQIGTLTASSITISGSPVTGLAGGTADLSATNGAVTVTGGTLAKLGTVSSVGAGAGIAVSADAVAVTTAATAGDLTLTADAGDLTLGSGDSGGAATLSASGNATVTTSLQAAGALALTAGLAAEAGTLSSTGAGVTVTGASVAITQADAATSLDVTANTGGLTLGTGSAGTTAVLSAAGPLTLTTLTAGTDATVTGQSVTAGSATATTGALALTATGGDLTLGSGSAATTASLTSQGGGDIAITSKLVAGGNATVTSADDVRLAVYDATADTGLIRSTAGDVAIDAQGSVYGIGGAENGLPTTQRGIAALTANGNLTITSDGDARFDSLGATGAITLDIAGSLTGSPLSGGTSTGVNVPGGAVFATGAGGDVSIRSGLAGAPTVDVVVLNRVVADRNITINADQLAIGTLTTNSGTITLNDTSGTALTADNYYVGQLNASGDVNVVLSGQPSQAISLIAPDGAGAPEFFDTSFGKTDLSAGTNLSGTIGKVAQLGDVAFGSSLNLDTAAAVADSVTSSAGSATITASTGTLAVLDASLGGSLSLTKQGGSAAASGDELRLRSATTAGNATLTSSTDERIGTLTSAGAVALSASNDITGLAGSSTGTSDAAFGRADFAAATTLDVTAGGLVQLGIATAGGAATVTAGSGVSDGAIDITAITAGGALTLAATALAPVTDAAHDGDILLGTANAGTTLLISNVGGGGDSGSIRATGAIGAGGDARIDAAGDVALQAVTSGGGLGVRARRDVATGTLGAAEDIGVNAGRDASLGALSAGDDVLVSATGTVTVASATARGDGPDTRTVSFASPSAIAFPSETNPGADIVLTSTGSSVTANGALSAASDVTVGAATSATLLGSTTATAGNVAVTSGTSSRLAGDVASGANTTVVAGSTATVQQNVSAGGNYVVTAGSGIVLGDASARTQQANGAVTLTANSGDVTQGGGRLTVVANADRAGAEALTITASNGSIVLANSQLTGGSVAGRESDVVLMASGNIIGDDLDGDRAVATAGGSITADTIGAGTGAADLGDLAQKQSVDLVANGGSVTLNTANALGAGHDIDIRAAGAITANGLAAGGTVVGRSGGAIALGTVSAGEDVALKSNGSSITISGAPGAGDDVLLSAAGAIATGSVTASGSGPDTRTVVFGSAGPLDAAYAAESNPGADIVLNSTGSSVTANGALAAASDVTVAAGTSATLLGSTTATSGNVAVTTGTSAQLFGDVVSGGNSTVTGGTTAAIQQNVTAAGNYTVTGATGVTLGDAQARTQQANGAVAITANAGDVAQGTGRLTVTANADQVGSEKLTVAAPSGSIVLGNSQLTGGSIAGRESEVVLSASGAITADDLDGDRVALSATGDIVADTIDAGTGSADSGDLAQQQSVDLVSSGGSVTVNAVQAVGSGHDIDIRAASAITVNSLAAGGSLIGRAGNAIALGTASAGEDVALKSNSGGITVTGATLAGDDVLFTAAGAIATGAVTASGSGADTRTVTFGAAPLDAVYAAESKPGADVVLTSTGAGITASGAVSAASDVSVNAATSAALLGSTTATAGNVSVSAGSGARLVGDVTSGGNTTVLAGTTATVQQNVTAAGNYTVTGGTGVALGDGGARTQQANGNVTITATSGDVTKGSGRLTIVSNADRTAANNTQSLAITAGAGSIVLANSQLTGGSVAGRESDVVLTATKGAITVGKVDGASLTARSATGFTAGEAIVAGNAVRPADPVNGTSTVEITVTGGGIGFTDVTATDAGHDIVLNATGAIAGGSLTAARTVTLNGGSVAVSGATTATAGSVTVNGGSSAALGSVSSGTSTAVTAGSINVSGAATTGSTLNLNATTGTLNLGSATSGGDVTLAAATRATLGPITATGRNVTLSASDADVNGNIAAGTIRVIDRASGANPLRLGDNAPGSGGFALSQAEVNRLNAATVTLDAGTSAGSRQDVAIGTLAIDADTGATRLDILGQQRFDVTGTISASSTAARIVRLGGSAADGTRATTMRFATTADAGGRVLVPGVALDLRADRIGMGFDANFLGSLGLTPGASPLDPTTVATNYIANGSSTLYTAGAFGTAAYTNQAILTADTLTVRYSDYALFQNTGGSAANAGAALASLADPSTPALVLMGPNPPTAGGFALFGTINGVPDSAASVLGDQVLSLTAVDRLNARVNGCVIGSGSGCIASTVGQPPLPPLNAFRGDIFSTQGDFSIPFDPVVGTNNESLFGDIGSFGLADLPLQPIECDPDKEGDCAREGEEPKQ